ncbi:Uma2 family endonuclease [Synechococcus sp. PCC 7336]|uniref:Uma2 family endonuclease n=1 Tax=Synechococcus sp. PCC 7336 TaxID=195250 RepID=UPI00037687B3|nr:Uma2 family endonuclease [Synechococcus sp. PCC 7336]
MTTTSETLSPIISQPEQQILLHGVSWQEYLVLDATFEERPGIRLSYLEGTLEMMTTSSLHEALKKVIARLLEIYAFANHIPLQGFGSRNYRSEALARGLEPDECYCLDPASEFPDLAIEVVLSSG